MDEEHPDRDARMCCSSFCATRVALKTFWCELSRLHRSGLIILLGEQQDMLAGRSGGAAREVRSAITMQSPCSYKIQTATVGKGSTETPSARRKMPHRS